MLLLLAALIGGRVAEAPRGPWDQACFQAMKEGDLRVVAYIGDRACVSLKPPEQMTGVWRDAFEGSEFARGVKSPNDLANHRQRTWLTLDDQSIQSAEFRTRPRNHAWRLVLIGREASDMHRRRPLTGYGHMNMSEGLVVVDRIVSATDLGPLDRESQP